MRRAGLSHSRATPLQLPIPAPVQLPIPAPVQLAPLQGGIVPLLARPPVPAHLLPPSACHDSAAMLWLPFGAWLPTAQPFQNMKTVDDRALCRRLNAQGMGRWGVGLAACKGGGGGMQKLMNPLPLPHTSPTLLRSALGLGEGASRAATLASHTAAGQGGSRAGQPRPMSGCRSHPLTGAFARPLVTEERLQRVKHSWHSKKGGREAGKKQGNGQVVWGWRCYRTSRRTAPAAGRLSACTGGPAGLGPLRNAAIALVSPQSGPPIRAAWTRHRPA